MKSSFFLFAIVIFCTTTFAASVDTVLIYSTGMHQEIKCVIIRPDLYKQGKLRFPVVYLLHGYSDRYDTWVKTVPAIKNYADQMQMVIACPDGGFNSWYFDSPVDPACQYDTYISKEVVEYLDTHYRTIPDRSHRAIAGLSMGGHGALYLALRHPAIFGAAGSMSGGVDLRPFPTSWDIAQRIGDLRSHPENWQKMSVVNMMGNDPLKPVAFMIECGTDDFFYDVNQKLHEKMLALKIPHDYVIRPGKHNWAYWGNAVEYQLLFFKKYFNNRGN